MTIEAITSPVNNRRVVVDSISFEQSYSMWVPSRGDIPGPFIADLLASVLMYCTEGRLVGPEILGVH